MAMKMAKKMACKWEVLTTNWDDPSSGLTLIVQEPPKYLLTQRPCHGDDFSLVMGPFQECLLRRGLVFFQHSISICQ